VTLLVVLLGLLIGLAIGATGVGGGVLTAPVLLLSGLSPAASVGTALAFSAVVKVSAVLTYIHQKKADFKVLAFLLAGGVPGATLGSLCLEQFQAAHSRGWIPIIVGATVAISAGSSLWRSRRHTASRILRIKWLVLFSFLIGVEVGFSSAGAGALGTVLLFNFTPLTPAAVVGTDLVFGMTLSAVGGGIHVAAGSWNPTVLIKLLAGGVVGATAGARLAGVLPAQILRSVVLLWAMLLGSILVYNGMEALQRAG
jgi:hypothetical protein